MFKLVLASLFLYTQFSFAGVKSSQRIELRSTQSPIQAGKGEYRFKLYDRSNKKYISDEDLSESHTKKLHMIFYDEALKEFSHVHPEFDKNSWKVEINLPVNGKYFVWAQGDLIDGEDFSSLLRTQVTKGIPQHSKRPLGDVRTGSDKGTVLELSKNKLLAEQMANLTFKVSREDGTVPVMKPYLGALAHVIATPKNGSELLHVHPMGGAEPNTGMLHASFPNKGEHRLWIQFIEHDVLKTIPISVIVY